MKKQTRPATFRILAVAFATALGLAFLPSTAFAAPSFTAATMTMSAGDPMESLLLRCTAAETGDNVKASVTVPDMSVVKLYTINPVTGEPAATGRRQITFTMASTMEEFYIEPVAPGEVTVTAELGGLTATITITVEAPSNISFTTADDSESLYYAESDTLQGAILRLNFGYTLSDPVTFTVTDDDPGDHVDYPASFTVLRGRDRAEFRFTAKDGENPAAVTFTFTGNSAFTEGASATVYITNAPPVLDSPTGTEERPTTRKVLQGALTIFTASAHDVVADSPVSYRWAVNGGMLDPTVYNTATINYAIDSDETIVTVWAVDKDGGRSETGYFQVTLDDSSTILFTDECTIQSIVDGQGNGNAIFHIDPPRDVDHAGQPWSPDGNKFFASKELIVRAEPALTTKEIGGVQVDVMTYPFGWFFSDPGMTDEANLYIPNPSTSNILIQTPSAGGIATIRYFSSAPYLSYYSQNADSFGTPIDDFGDFDQDGLSDNWETLYLDGGKDGTQHTSTEWGTLAVSVPTGKTGSSGTFYSGTTFGVANDTPDNDRLPTSSFETIPNVWYADPFIAAWGDDPTNKNAKNTVRVYKYPLTGVGYVDYGVHIFDESGSAAEYVASVAGRTFNPLTRRSATTKPFFSNIAEFRGLPQSSLAISQDGDHLNYVRMGYPGRLQFRNVHLRGNCPGTDPGVSDTDGDGRDDGWEYYFWSTILYENKPEY